MSRPLVALSLLMFTLIAAGIAEAGDFHGPYIGAYGGGIIGNSNEQTTTIFSPTGYFAKTSVPAIAATGAQHLRPSGLSGGGQVGYNFQVGPVVLGAEADYGAMNLNDSTSSSGTYPCCAPTGYTVMQHIKTDWLFTARPRLGFTVGHFLFYGTGGLASTRIKYRELFTDTFASARESAQVSKNKNGWTAGAGLEYQVAHHWSVKGEYLHADFGGVTTTSTNLATTFGTTTFLFPSNVWTHHADLRTNMVRAGLNFRF